MFSAPLSPRLRPLLWLAVYLLPTFINLRFPLAEFDTCWHLLTGQWILEHRQIPRVDPFTTVGEDRPWIAYSWLFGVLLDRLYAVGGLVAILLWRTLMGLAIVAALHRLVASRQASMLAQVVIVAGATLALTNVLICERPALFTVLFACATLEAILRTLERRSLGLCWGLPAIYVVWANLHIQFVHGLFFLGVTGVALLISWGQAIASHAPTNDVRAAFLRLFALGLLCAAATLVNPYGLRLYDVVLGYGGNREIYELFEELKSLRFRSVGDWATLGIFSAAVFSLGHRRDDRVAEMLLLGAAAVFSFHARHEVWIVVLVSALVLSRWPVGTPAPERLSARDGALVAGGVLAALSLWLVAGNLDAKLRAGWAEEFPEKAIDAWIAQPGGPPPGSIFTLMEWGAYAAWRLPPNRAVIDGRAQLHGGPRSRRLNDVAHGTPGWERDPDLLAARLILLSHHRPLTHLLRHSPHFRVFHEDAQAVIFVPVKH